MALKVLIGLLAAFAGFYAWLLGSVFFELYDPARRCGTPQAWALQGAACFFAPPAVAGAVGLFFVNRQRSLLGARFVGIGKGTLVVLLLCAFTNLIIFVPAP